MAIFLIIFLTIFTATNAYSWEIERIIDGDTIQASHSCAKLSKIRIRLYGIDAPEKKQPNGYESTEYLKNILPKGQRFEIKQIDIDRYGRIVALVYVEDKVINLELVEAGQAWVYNRYCKLNFCKDWNAQQKIAKSHKYGLWDKANALEPWK